MNYNRALFDAVVRGDLLAAEAALRGGAHPDYRRTEIPALTLAATHCRSDYPHERMVRLLVSAGADANARDSAGGLTPLMRAANVGNINSIKLLAELGADVNAVSSQGLTAVTYAFCQFHDREHRRPTLLKEVTSTLVECGADVDIGFTILMWAAQHGWTKSIGTFARYSQNIDAAYWKGRTALHLAAANGYYVTVQSLLAMGADPKACDDDGATPEILALNESPLYYICTQDTGAKPDYAKTIAEFRNCAAN